MAGVLLSRPLPTARARSSGLVSLGEPEQLGPLLRQALDRAQLCSSDPFCSEHDHARQLRARAACHACQFASETSCERGNRSSTAPRWSRRSPTATAAETWPTSHPRDIDDAVATVLKP